MAVLSSWHLDGVYLKYTGFIKRLENCIHYKKRSIQTQGMIKERMTRQKEKRGCLVWLKNKSLLNFYSLTKEFFKNVANFLKLFLVILPIFTFFSWTRS